jgi:hypothetical protein
MVWLLEVGTACGKTSTVTGQHKEEGHCKNSPGAHSNLYPKELGVWVFTVRSKKLI